MKLTVNPERVLFTRDIKIYGHFLEHFHRQIYGGVYAPENALSDKDGFRTDVIDALKEINTPVIRWPGGCYVSAYHWRNGVGKIRKPAFDKAWRVEETNEFGTDEFIKLCRKIGCEPYICTNAGTGTQEEMSNWVEYCNLPCEGEYAKLRIEGGNEKPYAVRYWSIGNENYLDSEIGSKTPSEWGRFVKEAAKMMKRVDPGIELSAAAIANIDWNLNLLKEAGPYLSWISIHGYWDGLWQVNDPANYTQCMARTENLDHDVKTIRGLLMAFNLEKKVRIAYDEWNLRGWHHPDVDHAPLGDKKFIEARSLADKNETYTMADAVFSACFLNMLLRNADIVGMANFAPVVNTRGAIYTYENGIVLRPTYYVFWMYTKLLGDEVIDLYTIDMPSAEMKDKSGKPVNVSLIDTVATRFSESKDVVISLINKDPEKEISVSMNLPEGYRVCSLTTLCGEGTDDYNDINRESVKPFDNTSAVTEESGNITVHVPAHSVNVLKLAQVI